MLRLLSRHLSCLVLLSVVTAAQELPVLPPAILPGDAWGAPAADGARWVARHAGLTARLHDDAIALWADEARLLLRLPGSGVHAVAIGSGARAHLYLGDDPAGWHTDVPLPEALAYRGLSGGVEVEVHGRHGRLGYDVRVPAGVPLGSVVLRLEGAASLSVDASGRLVAQTPTGRLLQSIPAAWTLADDGTRTPVEATFRVLGDGAYGFAATGRDPGRTLVIDPDLTWSSYLGGAVWDRVAAVADAGDGQILVAGFTSSPDFPTTPGAQQPALNGFAAAFVSRIDVDAGTLVWSTFLGGNDPPFLINEQATCLALDAAGAVHVGGWTVAADFPTTPGAYKPAASGAIEGFVTKLGGDGLLQWSTFLGGGKDDRITALDVGADGVVVTGYTTSNASPLFPTTAGAWDTTFSSIFFTPDGFVSKLSADGSALTWSTFLGGVLRDEPCGVHVDAAGLVTVTGLTGSNDFPATPGAFDDSYNGSTANETDAFVTRLLADGSGLAWSTYLGGDVRVEARGLSVDAAGRATVAGVVAGADFPVTAGAAQRGFGGGATDAFVARVAADGASLDYASFLGGSGDDEALAVAADAFGLATVVGSTTSPDLPVTPGAHAVLGAGATDAFVARFSPGGGVLRYGSYFGGSMDDAAFAVALDVHGAALMGGQAASADMPVTAGAIDRSYGGGGGDGLLARIDLPPWSDRGDAKPGTGGIAPRLVGAGSLEVGSAGTLTLTDARPSSAAFLFAGFLEGNAPFKGGILVPFPPAITLALFTSPAGTIPLGWPAWPPGIPSGFSLYFQTWVSDPAGVAGSSASNGVRGTQP